MKQTVCPLLGVTFDPSQLKRVRRSKVRPWQLMRQLHLCGLWGPRKGKEGVKYGCKEVVLLRPDRSSSVWQEGVVCILAL